LFAPWYWFLVPSQQQEQLPPQQESPPPDIGIVMAGASSPRGIGAKRERTRLFVVWPLGQVAALFIWLTGRKTSNCSPQGGQ
jgi:hypothetical protein